MPWITWISEDSASGLLKRVFDRLRGPHGVAHILKIHSLNPESLGRHHAYYRHIMFGPSGLSRAERETIAAVVSSTNNCFY
jgi:alkylhydroperoxidase family enzyme